MVIGAVEMLLIVSAVCGLWWAWRNTLESERDVRAVVDGQQNGLLLLTAKTVRSQQRAWGIVAGLLLVIMLTTIAPGSGQVRIVRRVAFIVIIVASAIGSGRADMHRRQLWQHVLEDERRRRELRRRSTDA